jgi:hypothetical protein
MNEKMNLLVFRDNWADEFDTDGFAFIKEDDWEYIQREAADTQFPKEVYFGSNEHYVFESAEDFIKAFKVAPITEPMIDEFRRIFHMKPKEQFFGICPYHGCEGGASDEFYKKEGRRLL